jgi:hypothetical protein
MCQTKTKVIIRKSRDGSTAKISGVCSHCGKDHTIDLGSVQAALNVITVFKMAQESKTADGNGIIYTYS